ncbi:MAG TPA: RCC1 domain-containing protein [Kofleriaceae bacterium]|jgi:hypothetical protein
MKWLWVVLACACSTPARPVKPSPVPVVAAPAGVAPTTKLVARGSLAAGDQHVCALRDNGRVACWGKGGTQLGAPGSADELVPVDVPGVEHAAGVAAARDLTCTWTAIGEAWCWGGEPSNRQTDHAPRRVPGLHDIVQIVAGFGGACGLRANGRVACWHADAWQDPLYPGPTEVAGIANAIEIAGDDEHLCARTKRDVLCTAISDLRHPSIANQHVIAISEAAGATSLAGYNEQFAALLPGGRLAAWDMAVIEDRVSPAPDQKVVVAPLPAAAAGAERLYAGGAVNGPIRFCAVGRDAGTCWNAGTMFEGSRALEAGVQDMAIGEETTCVRVADRARCRGMIGRRGDGGAELPAAPVPVQGISDARQLEASIMDRTCVVRASGRVACWGARWGSGPDGKPIVDHAPFELPGVDDAVEIAMSADVVCARRKHGAACWTTDIDGTIHLVDAPELAPAVRLFSGEEICGADATGAVACTHFEPEAMHPANGAQELQTALAKHLPPCVTTFNNGVECVHGAGNITLEHTDNYDQWCAVTGGKIMCRSTVTNPGVLAGFEKIDNVVSWDGQYALRADGGVTSEAEVNGVTDPSQPPVAKFHDVVELRDSSRTLCARLKNGTVECWGPRDFLGAGERTSPDAYTEVSGLALGIAPAIVPSAPPVVAPPAAPSGPPIVLHGIAMQGPFATEGAACSAQHCKAGETLDCRVDDDDPADAMASPPAPFQKARLVSMDCRDPAYHRDGTQTYRLLVERGGKAWLSRPLFSAGGNDHYCGMDMIPSWETRVVVAGGSPELVATVFTRTSCRGGNGGDDRDDRLLVVAGNGATPYYFAPLATAAGTADACSDDGGGSCKSSEETVQLVPTFTADGTLALAGDRAAAKSHKLAAVGIYRFAGK